MHRNHWNLTFCQAGSNYLYCITDRTQIQRPHIRFKLFMSRTQCAGSALSQGATLRLFKINQEIRIFINTLIHDYSDKDILPRSTQCECLLFLSAMKSCIPTKVLYYINVIKSDQSTLHTVGCASQNVVVLTSNAPQRALLSFLSHSTISYLIQLLFQQTYNSC